MKLSTVLIGLAAADTADAFTRRRRQRRRAFDAAVQRADETGKPLLVVGAPRNGLVTRLLPVYGCGDLCIDLDGCAGCPSTYEANVEDLSDFASNSYVVYVSCVLEYVTDIDAAVDELQRIAGPDLFIVHVPPWSLASVTYPGARHRILSAPMGDNAPVRWKTLPWR